MVFAYHVDFSSALAPRGRAIANRDEARSLKAVNASEKPRLGNRRYFFDQAAVAEAPEKSVQ